MAEIIVGFRLRNGLERIIQVVCEDDGFSPCVTRSLFMRQAWFGVVGQVKIAFEGLRSFRSR